MTGNPSVQELMTRQVVTLDANEALGVADDVMGLARIRHMPVIDENGLVIGLVSQRDLFRGALARALGYGEFAQKKLLGIMRVKEVMTTDIVSVSPSTPLTEAATLMIDRKIGCLVVVDQKKLVGILTESDFVKLAVATATATNENGSPK